MTKIILIRHGYSLGNKEKKFTGQLDLPLDAVGFVQADSIRDYILKEYKVDKIFSSDLQRAYDTVKPLADALQLDVVTSKALREFDVGLWSGVAIEEVKNKFPAEFEVYKNTPGMFRFPNGENYEEIQKRAVEFITDIAEENKEKTIVVGTHGGVIRVLRALWTDTPLSEIQKIAHVSNASVTIAEYENGKFSLKEVGITDHLSEKVSEEEIR